MPERFLSPTDLGRAERTLQRLSRHDIRSWVLTGGLATEIHHELRGFPSSPRTLNDIDFIVESFDGAPETLAEDFLFRHIHPSDPPNKTILQAIDVDSALRVDVFRSRSEVISRSGSVNLWRHTFRLISLEDLLARSARIALDVVGGVPTPRKYVADFLRLLKLADANPMEVAWQDHRRPAEPATFREASALLQSSIPSRPELLITPVYSTVAEICSRCQETPAFRLAQPETILSVLGYC